MGYSVLFPDDNIEKDSIQSIKIDMTYFKDIGLDHVFNDVLRSKKEFELDYFFHQPLEDVQTIIYRQEVMKEFENESIRQVIQEFSNEVYLIRKYMDRIRKNLSSSEAWDNNYLTRGHLFDYAERYIKSILMFKDKIVDFNVNSNAINYFISYLNDYLESPKIVRLMSELTILRDDLSNIEYCMFIKGGTIRVFKYEGQIDYSKQILKTFEKFRQGDVKDYRHKLSEEPVADHVEAAVLELLSKVYKDTFDHLTDFCNEFMYFDDETIIRFSRESQFYIAWLDYIQPLISSGLKFNYPKILSESKNVYSKDSFDLALASKIKEKTVVNDFYLTEPEQFLVVTGPNQGGKTTFAKMFAQLHHFGSIGVCVPGSETAVFLFNQIFTHFSKQEDLSNMEGKLKDDLKRLHHILVHSSNRSIIIINEILTSTTLEDAITIGKKMLERLQEREAIGVIVTFIDELANYSKHTVSLMCTVDEFDPVKRMFKIVRKPPDGLAYAHHIALKHHLTYEQLCRRLKNES